MLRTICHGHPFDRGAVAAGMKPICARVLVLSTPSRVPSCASPSVCQADEACCHADARRFLRAESLYAVRRTRANPYVHDAGPRQHGAGKDAGALACGVIGDRRPEPVAEERSKGWAPWQMGFQQMHP